MQRIHNLPDHERQDVNAKQNTDSSIEFPWFEMLLGNRGGTGGHYSSKAGNQEKAQILSFWFCEGGIYEAINRLT